MMKNVVIGGAIIVVVAIAGVYAWKMWGGEKPLRTTLYTCDEEKTIDATFYTNTVTVKLSDARTLDLAKLFGVVEGVDERYGNEDQSIVFSLLGSGAFIAEGVVKEQTFRNCDIVVPGQDPLSTYASSTLGISLKYPKGWTADESYKYEGFPKKPIAGVKFTIPMSVATGTNLSSDTYIALEWLPRANSCSGDIYVVDNVRAADINDNGTPYSVASTSGAGAGNFYEEMVYALPDSKPCTAIRYFIHSMNIGNFEPGAVREFDRAALISAFDTIRRSLQLNQQSTLTP